MTKLIFASLTLISTSNLVLAANVTPGPLLGAVAGPWGLVASVVGYGAYRYYKARR